MSTSFLPHTIFQATVMLTVGIEVEALVCDLTEQLTLIQTEVLVAAEASMVVQVETIIVMSDSGVII